MGSDQRRSLFPLKVNDCEKRRLVNPRGDTGNCWKGKKKVVASKERGGGGGLGRPKKNLTPTTSSSSQRVRSHRKKGGSSGSGGKYPNGPGAKGRKKGSERLILNHALRKKGAVSLRPETQGGKRGGGDYRRRGLLEARRKGVPRSSHPRNASRRKEVL